MELPAFVFFSNLFVLVVFFLGVGLHSCFFPIWINRDIALAWMALGRKLALESALTALLDGI